MFLSAPPPGKYLAGSRGASSYIIMRRHLLFVYVTSTALAAVGVLFFADWDVFYRLNTNLGSLDSPAWIGWLALLSLGILSEALAVSVTVAASAGTSSIIFIPILSSLLLFGPFPTAILAVIAGFFGEVVIRHKSSIKATFNISQYFLSTYIAGLVFHGLNGHSFLSAQLSQNSFELPLVPFVGFIIAYIFINTLLVSSAITIHQRVPLSEVWAQLVGRSGTNILYDVLISPIAVAVALLYREAGLIGLAVTVLPLLFIRHSYLVNLRLQAAIRDLLTALVKAIETRDPYTSGHSLRVSDLAVHIAQEMGLGKSRIEDCKNSALLHDIGKIDPIYNTILKKPDSLTPDEREVIESHVDKGVEFVESMASFPPNVVAGIRHHHERVDGRGYPDKLKGNEIPVEARIIKVCDAIDAMLSDRPYRDALPLESVKEQLRQFSGTQFDPQVVSIVLSSRILEEHQASVDIHRGSLTGGLPKSEKIMA